MDVPSHNDLFQLLLEMFLMHVEKKKKGAWAPELDPCSNHSPATYSGTLRKLLASVSPSLFIHKAWIITGLAS